MTLPIDQVLHGDCLEVLRTLPDNSLDSIVTDPPYGLGQDEPTPEELLEYLQGADLVTGDFMNKPWNIPPVAVWKECFRVLKPGGYLLAFAGTRTFDLMSMGIRMAGFENRDTIAAQFGFSSTLQWIQSQGFPKSHNISKGIDRKLGVERKVIGTKRGVGGENLNDIVNGREVRQTTDDGGKGVGAYGVGAKQVAIDIPVTAPGSEEARKWDGWGTALKPSWEPVLCFRKPIAEKTVVDQMLKTGTGAINIDACRVRNDGGGVAREGEASQANLGASGRWPANALLVHSEGCKVIGTKKVKAPVINRFEDGMKPFGEGAGHSFTSTKTGDVNGEEEVPVYECVEGCPVKVLDEQSGLLKSGKDVNPTSGSVKGFFGSSMSYYSASANYGDSGGASRFFAQFMPDAPFYYQAKAGSSDKKVSGAEGLEQHPTVKPLKLMQYLVRLVTQPGGVVLDPYSGSGTTCVAAKLEGMHYIGIEKHEPYVQRARLRLEVGEPAIPVREASSAPAPARNSILDLALSDDD